MRKVEKINEVLKRAVKKLDLDKRFQEARVMESWKETVGRQIARHTQPIGIKKKKLFVRVDNSSWIYQLTLHHKTEILNKINQGAEKPILKDIFFKLGKIEKGKVKGIR